MYSKVYFEDISLCFPNMSAQNGQHFVNIATFGAFFHVICHVVLLIANMLAMKQPTSAGEARQERSSSMREVLAAAKQQRTMRRWHWVVAEAMGNGDGGNRCRVMANITISQTQ
jgi:hypothetical protein